jgi:ketosteroid isomerase-like protein
MDDLSRRNMDLVRGWVDAINRNDVEAQLECWQPDGEFVVTPTGTTYRGLPEIRRAGERSAAAIGAQPGQGRKQITHLDAGEDWAVVEYDTRADIKGPFNLGTVTVLPAGVSRTVVTRACVVIELRRGKFQRAQEFFDTLSMPQQLGIDRATLEKMYASLAGASDSTVEKRISRPAEEAVRQFIAAWNPSDVDGLAGVPGTKVTGPEPTSLPYEHVRVDRLVSAGDTVAVEGLATGTSTAGTPSPEAPVAMFFRVDPGGLIVEVHLYRGTDLETSYQGGSRGSRGAATGP